MAGYHFTIPGKPATGSFRFTMLGRRYTPANVSDWRAFVRLVATEHCREPMEGPVALEIVVRRPAPASNPKRPTKRNPWPWAWWKKPDCDNLSKPIKDALKAVAFRDDAQVVDLHVRKEYHQREEVAVAVVQVQEHYSPGNGSGVALAGRTEATITSGNGPGAAEVTK